MKKATVRIVEDNWVRIVNANSHGKIQEYTHVFVVHGSESRLTIIVSTGNGTVTVSSGFDSLKVLKTTQSSFEHFY